MHLGIDFGTCFTSAAVLTGNQFRFVRDQSGGNALPFYASAACLTPEGELLLGALAKNTARKDPSRFRQEFKRDLGSNTPYLLGDREFLPQDLIACLLARMKQEAEKIHGTLIPAAVLTVPASYDSYRRELMLQSGVAAGFREDGVVLLDEPEAAALAYDWQLKQQSRAVPEGTTLLVYDLGGGTFDAALMRKEGDRFRSLAPPVGDANCGGIDFDRAIYQEVFGVVEEELQVLLAADNVSVQSLRMKLQIADYCREVKHHLTNRPAYDDVLPVLSAEEFRLSQALFAEKIAPYVERTVSLCKELALSAGCTWDTVDGILLVGGSSQIPSVMSRLSETFHRPLWQLDEPQLAVCKGAAILPGYQRTLKSAVLERIARTNLIMVSGNADGRIHIWDTTTGEIVKTLSGHSGAVSSTSFSPDDRMLASGSHDNTIKIWDVSKGEIIQTLTGHSDVVHSIAFSRDGKTLASGSHDRTVRIWDVGNGEMLQALTEHSDRVYGVAYSSDGKILVSSSHDKMIRIWNAETYQNIRTISDGSQYIYCVAISPDNKWIADAGDEARVSLWDASTGASIRALTGHSGDIYSIAFSPDNTLLVTAGSDMTIRFWDVLSGELIRTILGHSAAVLSIAFSHDGKTLTSGSADQNVCLWDVSTGELIRTLTGRTGTVHSIAYPTDDSTSIDSSGGHSGRVSSLSIDSEGEVIVSGGSDKTIKIWDADMGGILVSLRGDHGRVSALTFIPERNTIAAADSQLSFWQDAPASPNDDVKEARRTIPLFGPRSGINFIAASPDGKLIATVNDDALLCLWDTETHELVHVFYGHRAGATSVVFSPDGSLVISGSEDQSLKLWSVAERRLLATLKGHEAGVLSVAIAPDGKTLASAGRDRTVRLWDTASRGAIHTLTGHTDAVRSVAFSRDGSTLVSAGADRTIRLWNVATGDPFDTLEGHEDAINAVLFTGNDARLVSASDDRSVRFWKLDWK